jgi:hypothetical protein
MPVSARKYQRARQIGALNEACCAVGFPPLSAANLRAMRALRIVLICAFIAVVLASSAALAAEKVDLLLVLAADVSRSINGKRFDLQRQGYAVALADTRVLEAIRSGRQGRIAVSFIEWSGEGNQKVLIDWKIIGDAATAKRFGDVLLEAPRSFEDRTSISGGIEAAMAQLALAPYQSGRRTIDVSGDGTNNAGRDVTLARDEAISKGVTINGLPILSDNPMSWNPEHTNPPGGLENYYRNNVIGGPGAFAMVAKNFDSFGQAIINKMIAEVSQAHETVPRQARAH